MDKISLLDGKDFLFMCDYFSKFFEVCKLGSTTSESVIKYLKNIFVQHGTPISLVSDNGPQYASRTFQNFLKAAPKTKAKSPAELLMGRKIRTLLPIVKYHRKKNRDKENSFFSKQWYNQHTCRLPELKPGAYIRYRHKGLWEPAQVVSRVTILRPYIIKTKDRMLRRNRQHLVNGEKHHSLIPTHVEYTLHYEHQPDGLQQSAPAAPYQEVPEQPTSGVPAQQPPMEVSTEPSQQPAKTIRSGRVVKLPIRYQE
ncbi:hypothetical protein RRG08_031373 [Elysia crispata]|uniref:Integrase catalytic domain-containing protein n=1 Tax=Elysia crispata TaxID=231223 RepID=A0AAE1DIV0_9GAST|nr:hypothetical protein RRG08_031373 [Elysia crispata]